MEETSRNMEAQILEAAEKCFLAKGFAMTSTTEIAKSVGCNQALVHYYFRTKEQLFTQVFSNKIEFIMSAFLAIDSSSDNFLDKLQKRIDTYFDMLAKNRQLPFLIANELLTNKNRREFIRQNIIQNKRNQDVYYKFKREVETEVNKGTIRPVEALDLLLNIASLTIMNFVALPIYIDLLQKSEQDVDQYLLHRKAEVIETIMRSLLPDTTEPTKSKLA